MIHLVAGRHVPSLVASTAYEEDAGCDLAYATCTNIEVLLTLAMLPTTFVDAWAALGGVFKSVRFMSLTRLAAILLPATGAVTLHDLMCYFVCSPAAHQALMWRVAALELALAYAGASWMLARASDAKKAAIEEADGGEGWAQ